MIDFSDKWAELCLNERNAYKAWLSAHEPVVRIFAANAQPSTTSFANPSLEELNAEKSAFDKWQAVLNEMDEFRKKFIETLT